MLYVAKVIKMDKLSQQESDAIKSERIAYAFEEKAGLKFFYYLSNVFMVLGFISLALVFFTEVTLVHATCFFVIGYTLTPTDVDSNRVVIKGVTEDIANIRLNTAVISKKCNVDKNT